MTSRLLLQPPESLTNEEDVVIQHIDDDLLIHFIRYNTICRHLASLVMRPYEKVIFPSLNGNHTFANGTTSKKVTSMLVLDRPDLILIQRMANLWPRLLELPPPPGSVPQAKFPLQ